VQLSGDILEELTENIKGKPQAVGMLFKFSFVDSFPIK